MTDASRTALVTGGNRGLGLETGRQLAARGFRVLLTSRAVLPKEEVAPADAGKLEHRALDVTNGASIAALGARLARQRTRLHVLVNNAGVSLHGFDAERVRRTLAVNFYGAMNVTDALLPLIPDGGTIVMVSSGMGELAGVSPALRAQLMAADLTRAGLVELMNAFVSAVERGRHAEEGWPSSAYRASKIGLNALTRIFARDLSPRRIRVNAVCPGWVKTDMGGQGAPRDVAEGAASIVWAAALADGGPTGGFFRDGRPIAW
jgi:NAD(P)-dependent dehydrogenase (short-subunit alcohol dehydrogenase family)